MDYKGKNRTTKDRIDIYGCIKSKKDRMDYKGTKKCRFGIQGCLKFKDKKGQKRTGLAYRVV